MKATRHLREIQPNGTIIDHHFDDEPPLEWFHEKVGGYIEVVRPRGWRLDNGDYVPNTEHRMFVCNDEGMRLELPINTPATLMYVGPDEHGGTTPVLGTIIQCMNFDLE